MPNSLTKHSLKDSIESILSVSRKHLRDVLSHLQEYGHNYLQNAGRYRNGDLDIKTNGTVYGETFQNHFNNSDDSPLGNLIRGIGTNLGDVNPTLENLVQLHWYDFLIEIATSEIRSSDLMDHNGIRWGIYHNQKNWAILEIIHLILLHNSDPILMRKWIDIFQYAEYEIIQDWNDFLQHNHGILDGNHKLVQDMLEHRIYNIYGKTFYGKNRKEPASLGDYWNQVFDKPDKLSDFQKEVPSDAQIFLRRKRHSKSFFPEELIPNDYLKIAINRSFKHCYIFESRYDDAVTKQFVDYNDWMFESGSVK